MPSMPGELRRVPGGAEQPDLRLVADPGDGGDVVVGVALGELAAEEADQLRELAREVLVGERLGGAAQRRGGDPVGAGRAADPEVDAPGVQRLEHPELLGDDQRRVVGQHHPAGADPDPLGRGGERRGEHRRRRARDPGHVVVLGDPVAVIAEPLDRSREVDRVARAPRRGSSPRRRSRGRGRRAWVGRSSIQSRQSGLSARRRRGSRRRAARPPGRPRADRGRARRRSGSARRRGPPRAACRGRPGRGRARPRSAPTSCSTMSSPPPTVRMSSSTSVTCGVSLESPSRRPAAAEEVTTPSAPPWWSRWTFSSSRTAATIVAFG